MPWTRRTAPERSCSISSSATGPPRCLSALGIPAEWLPPTFEGPEFTGDGHRLRPRAETGLKAGTPVAAGGGDQAAQAVGVGAVEPGIIALTLGTSGVVFATTPSALIEPEGPAARLLPCRARTMAFHGRDAQRGGQPAVAPGYARAGDGFRRPVEGSGSVFRPAARACSSCRIFPANAPRTRTRWRAAPGSD